MNEFKDLTVRNASSLDMELVELVREIIDLPSTNDTLKMSHHLAQTPQSVEVDSILKHKVGLIPCR